MLKNLKIENFRNIENETFDLYQKSAFTGKNELGKTNHLIAIYWLLTGEIIEPDACFNNKQPKGADILPKGTSKLIASVEGNLNGFIIKRTFQEKWTRTRGTLDEIFQGYESNFYVDGAKIPATKVNDKVLEICNCNYALDTKLNKVAILTDPYYLLAKIDYKDLRKTIFDIVGDVSTDEVLKTGDYDLAIESIKKGDIENKRTSLKRIIKEYEPKIESKKGEILALNGVLDADRIKVLENNKNKLIEAKIGLKQNPKIDEIKDKIDKLNTIKYSLTSQLNNEELEAKKACINPKVAEIKKAIVDKKSELNEVAIKGQVVKNKIAMTVQKINDTKMFNKDYSNSRIEKMEELAKISEKQFKELRCPNCNELINKEDLAAFEQKKNNEINDCKEMIDLYEKKIEKGLEDITNLNNQLSALESEKKDLANTYRGLDSQIISLYTDLENEINKKVGVVYSDNYYKLKTDLGICEEDIALAKQELELVKIQDEELKNNKIDEIDSKIQEIDNELKDLYAIERNLKAKAIKEEELNQMLKCQALDEATLYQLDQFIKNKIRMVNEKVSLFFDVNFVMLENQINGGLQEVCYPTYKNVKYENINTAEKIKIGVKIINAIRNSLHLGDLPILFDGGESLDNDNINSLSINQIITTIVNNEDTVDLKNI